MSEVAGAFPNVYFVVGIGPQFSMFASRLVPITIITMHAARILVININSNTTQVYTERIP